MKKLSILLLALCLCSSAIFSQSESDKEEVLKVVVKLFDGMRAGDSSIVRSTFYHQVEMYTSYTNREGKAVLKKDSFKKFVNAVGTPHDEIWDEVLWDEEVRIDGNLAQVWTKYGFYLGDKFSHCGVDAFHLTKTPEGWKIFHLTDTRQRNGCEVPENLQKDKK